MDVRGKTISLVEWRDIIEDMVENPRDEPIWNVASADEDDREYDSIIIGGGAAGRFSAAFTRARGGRVMVVDKWPFLGGSCPHEACVPHHVFSESARELDLARWFSGQLWFSEFDEKRASITEIIRLFTENRAFAHAIMNFQSKDQLHMEYVLNTAAKVIDNHTVEVAGRQFRTRNIVLATGARPVVPDVPGIDMRGVFNYSNMLYALDYEPNRCVIIGGSKVAIEYGSFFQATGCRTTILTRSPLMRTASMHHVDEGLRQKVLEHMRIRGVDVLEGAVPVEVLGNGKVAGVRFRTADGTEHTLDCDFVFLGTGEQAQSQPFVDALGVETDERGNIRVDLTCRTSVEGVYAVGDLIGPPMEMFKARKTGCVAARNIMGEHWEWDYRDYPDFLHSTYEIAWTGLSEEEARAKYPKIMKIQMPPEGLTNKEVGMPASDGTMLYAMRYPELTGFCKLLVNAETRKIVGAHYLGYGIKNAFQYIDFLMRRPEGFSLDEMGEVNELFLNELFPQLARLRAGQLELEDL
ncbi:MAG: FAD-dependent oxidoreductase [Acidimicrobiia bacterium]